MRYFIELAYDGSDYHGWQIQKNALTLQEVVERCMHTVFQSPIPLVGAGRTDTGVHARQFIAHFDWKKQIDSAHLCYKLNRMLPDSIAVKRVYRVRSDAHARFDALSREYHYQMIKQKNPFKREYFVFNPHSLDLEEMNKAGEILRTHRDFQCFSKVKTDVKTYLCEIEKAVWETDQEELIFKIVSNRFLRDMVRAIVGTLLEVGRGRIDLDEFKAILNSKNRSRAGKSVPAKGLFLHKINYPDDIKTY